MKVYDIGHGTEYSREKNETGDTDGRYEYYPSSVFSFPFLRRFIRRHMNGGRDHSLFFLNLPHAFIGESPDLYD